MILLRFIIAATIIGLLSMVSIGLVLGSRKPYELLQEAQEKTKEKTKEKKVKEKAPIANPDIVAALRSLGFKKRESVEAAQAAVEKLGNAKIGVLIKEALRHV